MIGVNAHCKKILQALPNNRILAVDAFRGIAITAMILVNNPGSWQHVYPPLLHAQWHGWTVTDLIFPFFLFIVGIAISISIPRQLEKGMNGSEILYAAAVRMTKLVALGLFLAVFYYNFIAPDYNWFEQRILSIRIPGVLQRIGVVYFATVGLVLLLNTTGRLITTLAVLIGYWALLVFVPYSDANGFGYVGLFEHGNSLVAWLDNAVFGTDHVYYPAATPFAFDPEGILSTLPSIASCLTGVLAGQWLASNQSMIKKSTILLVVGIVLLIIGEIWDIVFPINKALWTSSFVMMSSGCACIVLAILMFLVDVKGYKQWTAPLLVFGANSIAFYMFAGVTARLLFMIPVDDTSLKSWLYNQCFQPIFGNVNGSLAFAITFLLVSYVVMYQMYRKGIFWKV